MQTPDFKLGPIGHVLLGVRNLPAAVAFYRDKLGLALRFESAEFVFLDGGGVTLALSLPLAQAAARSDGRLAGATEIVFSVTGVRESYEALRARGVEFTHQPHVATGNLWAANFTDPDGHALSIFGPERTA